MQSQEAIEEEQRMYGHGAMAEEDLNEKCVSQDRFRPTLRLMNSHRHARRMTR